MEKQNLFVRSSSFVNLQLPAEGNCGPPAKPIGLTVLHNSEQNMNESSKRRSTWISAIVISLGVTIEFVRYNSAGPRSVFLGVSLLCCFFAALGAVVSGRNGKFWGLEELSERTSVPTVLICIGLWALLLGVLNALAVVATWADLFSAIFCLLLVPACFLLLWYLLHLPNHVVVNLDTGLRYSNGEPITASLLFLSTALLLSLPLFGSVISGLRSVPPTQRGMAAAFQPPEIALASMATFSCIFACVLFRRSLLNTAS
jgi:hypothetical protein